MSRTAFYIEVNRMHVFLSNAKLACFSIHNKQGEACDMRHKVINLLIWLFPSDVYDKSDQNDLLLPCQRSLMGIRWEKCHIGWLQLLPVHRSVHILISIMKYWILFCWIWTCFCYLAGLIIQWFIFKDRWLYVRSFVLKSFLILCIILMQWVKDTRTCKFIHTFWHYFSFFYTSIFTFSSWIQTVVDSRSRQYINIYIVNLWTGWLV